MAQTLESQSPPVKEGTIKVDVVSSEITPRLKLSLIARLPIAKGEVIFRCSPKEIQEERSWRTIQIDHNLHVRNEYLDYVDHACEPNSVFEIGTLSMVALRDISPRESITFFYPGAEVELAQDFHCECGSPFCLGHIKGGFYLSKEKMRWALEQKFCTAFMERHFRRFLVAD